GGDRALVCRVPVGVQKADRDRFRVEVRQRVELERRELAGGDDASANADTALEGNERLGMRLAEAVERSTVLTSEVQQVLEPRVRHEGCVSALPLQQRVRCDGRPVGEACAAV